MARLVAYLNANTSISTELADLAKLTNEYAEKSKSKNTRKAYKSDWRDFDYWCRCKYLPVMPADSSTVAAYIADRATNSWVDYKGAQRSPLKVASLERRLTTISQAHNMANQPFNRKHPLYKRHGKVSGILAVLPKSEKNQY